MTLKYLRDFKNLNSLKNHLGKFVAVYLSRLKCKTKGHKLVNGYCNNLFHLVYLCYLTRRKALYQDKSEQTCTVGLLDNRSSRS